MSDGLKPLESLRLGWLPRWYGRRWPGSRAGWRQTLAASGLPVQAIETIQEVLTRAKLNAAEKQSVARELVAHFEDGHDDGCSYEQLIANFGDSHLVANLIQRAKIRNRSMISTFLKLLAATIVIFIAVVGAMWGAIKMRKAAPSRNYLAELTLPVVEAADDDKAWPIYRGPWIDVGFCEYNLMTIVEVDEQQILFQELSPGDPGWEQVVECLDEHAELLAAFREGSNRPRLGIELQFNIADYDPLDQQALFPQHYERVVAGEIKPATKAPDTPKDPMAETGLLGVMLPHMRCLRYASEMFIVDTRLAISEGNIDRAIANVEASFGLARQVNETPFLVSSLVSFAMFDNGVSQIAELVSADSNLLNDEQILHLQNVVGALDLDDWISTQGERAAFNDLVQTLFTDDGDGNGKLTLQGMQVMTGFSQNRVASGDRTFWKDVGQLVEFTTYDRKEIVDAHTAKLDAFEKHLYKRPFESPIDIELTVDSGNTLINTFMFDPQPIRGAQQMRVAKQDAVELALAIERFRRSTGELPETLDELTPNFIDQIPLDPITGGDMLYRVDGEGFLLYSVGLDRDDDGGEPVVIRQSGGQSHTEFNFHYDGNSNSGDWLLWPRVPESSN